jgi:hypothetical protein
MGRSVEATGMSPGVKRALHVLDLATQVAMIAGGLLLIMTILALYA